MKASPTEMPDRLRAARRSQSGWPAAAVGGMLLPRGACRGRRRHRPDAGNGDSQPDVRDQRHDYFDSGLRLTAARRASSHRRSSRRSTELRGHGDQLADDVHRGVRAVQPDRQQPGSRRSRSLRMSSISSARPTFSPAGIRHRVGAEVQQRAQRPRPGGHHRCPLAGHRRQPGCRRRVVHGGHARAGGQHHHHDVSQPEPGFGGSARFPPRPSPALATRPVLSPSSTVPRSSISTPATVTYSGAQARPPSP